MKYLWTEDTGAGLHFWELVNQLFFDDAFVIESKGSNQGLLDALSDIDMKEDDKYYIAFDYVVDNQDIRNKYRILKSIADKAEGKIIILNMICFEYLILAFDKLVAWTGTGKTDKIKIREEVLSAIEDHRINLSKIDDVKTLQYLAGFKRYSTERVMKSLVGEFTQNEKWSVTREKKDAMTLLSNWEKIDSRRYGIIINLFEDESPIKQEDKIFVKSIDYIKGMEGEKCLFILTNDLAAHLFNNNTETNKTKNKLYVALTRSLNELSIYILKEVEDKYTKKRIQDFFERYL